MSIIITVLYFLLICLFAIILGIFSSHLHDYYVIYDKVEKQHSGKVFDL